MIGSYVSGIRLIFAPRFILFCPRKVIKNIKDLPTILAPSARTLAFVGLGAFVIDGRVSCRQRYIENELYAIVLE